MLILYVQQPDFSIKQIGSVSLKDAIKILQDPVLDLEDGIRYGWEQAEPLIGFKRQSGAFIEVNKNSDDSYSVRLDSPALGDTDPRRRRFNRSSERYHVLAKLWRFSDVEEVIGLFFAGKDLELARILEGNAQKAVYPAGQADGERRDGINLVAPLDRLTYPEWRKPAASAAYPRAVMRGGGWLQGH